MAFWQKLRQGLQKTSHTITSTFTKVIGSGGTLTNDQAEQLEEALIMADTGVTIAHNLVEALRGKDLDLNSAQQSMIQQIAQILAPFARPIEFLSKPHVVMVMGMNGSGKTTTLGKLANHWALQGKKVRLVAGDTFRAAAVAQLQVWANRVNVPIISGPEGCDAAGLVYDAYQQSIKAGDDVLLVDTAGRLHTNQGLMDELAKVVRVVQKINIDAPHSRVLVLDAVVGQNALTQIEAFHKAINLSGLIMTKLDGTARGGILLQVAQKYQLPIHAIGVGEGLEDLQDLEVNDFAKALVGVEG